MEARTFSTLTTNDVKEELSYAYVHAVASRAGFTFDYRRKDRDSVDVILSGRRQGASERELCSVSLELQVKATAVEDFDREWFPFDLPVKNYNDLRVRTLCPRLLVVFVMPQLDSLWLSAGEDTLSIRRCGYWHNLKGEPPVDNVATRTVRISRGNIFTPEKLSIMMERIARQEEIGYAL